MLPKLKIRSTPVLPTVYSDSLSYYEELNKIKWYINKIIEGTEIDPNNIEYIGVITTFGGTLEDGFYSVLTNETSEHFPTGFSGKGTLMIIKGAQNTEQATLFSETGNVYTRTYYFDTETWDSDWSEAEYTKTVDVSENAAEGVFVDGRWGYIKYTTLGREVFLDAVIDLAPTPTQNSETNICSGLPSDAHHSIYINWQGSNGHIIGTGRVKTDGTLVLSQAWNMDSFEPVAMPNTSYIQIHATYRIVNVNS